jgi:hypothetical protein
VRVTDIFAADKMNAERVILEVKNCESLENNRMNEFDSAESVRSRIKPSTLALHSSSTCALRAPDHDTQETTSAQQSIPPIPDHFREFL